MPSSRALLALLGFTPLERRSFATFLAPEREAGPGYELTGDLLNADCAVADADDPQAMSLLLDADLLPRAVLLGHTPYSGCALQLPRPINLLLVLRALDTVVGARPRTATRLATAPGEPRYAQAAPPPANLAPVADPAALAAAADPAALAAVADPAALAAVADTAAAAPLADTAARAPALSAASSKAAVLPAPGTRAPFAEAAGGLATATPAHPVVPARPLPKPTPPPLARPARGEDQVQRVLDELAFRTATLPPNIDTRALAAEGAPGAAAASGSSALHAGRPAVALERAPADRPRARAHVLPLEHILVIDNDRSTLRLVATELQRFGFQIHLAGQADDALRLLTSRFHDYVFVDPALPGLDALLVCRMARQIAPPAPDRPATTVVLLADPNGLATLLERALPAADACLRKPLEQGALLKLMGEREVARVAYADTARLTTII